jgi:hypothetical protein
MKVEGDQSLASLAALIGDWTMESPQFPELSGRAKIEWIEDGAYIAVRDEVDRGDVPSGMWIVGADDSTRELTSLYHDSRGVRRVYQMSLADGVWKIWRNAPQFNQRFTGKLARDGHTITGQWEMSTDGTDWKLDFELVYRKVTQRLRT